MKEQKVSAPKIALKFKDLTLDGAQLGSKDVWQVNICWYVYETLLTELTEMFVSNPSTRQLSKAVAAHIQLIKKDVKLWISTLDSGRDALLRSQHDQWNSDLQTLIPWPARVVARAFCIEPDPHVFRALNTLCSFPRKLKLRVAPDETLAKFHANEERLREVVAAGYPDDIISAARAIINEWFKDFRMKEIRPHHGVGAVAEPGVKTRRDKYDCMSYHAPLDSLLRQKGLGSIFDYVDAETAARMQFANPCDSTARLITVPKTYKAVRVVKPEPCTLQYFQQAVKDQLYDFIEHHPYLGKRIPLEDQGVNRELARTGSATGLLATMDSSNASDNITWELVRQLFRDLVELLAWLEVLRSPWYRDEDGNIVETPTFAGMGSALCFPVECIVFAALNELSLRTTEPSEIDRHLWRWSIYGDDSIVPAAAVPRLLELHAALGLQINEEKSFVDRDDPFRESCGIECLDGADVTPFKWTVDLPTLKTGRKPSGPVVVALVAKHNEALIDFGLQRTARAIGEILRAYGAQSLCWTADATRRELPIAPSYETLLPSQLNGSLRRRWNKDLQRSEYRASVLRSRPVAVNLYGRLVPLARETVSLELDSRDDELGYLEWLSAHSGHDDIGDVALSGVALAVYCSYTHTVPDWNVETPQGMRYIAQTLDPQLYARSQSYLGQWAALRLTRPHLCLGWVRADGA